MTEPDVELSLQPFVQQIILCDNQPLFHIDEQGRWFYREEPLPDKFCRLFASILVFVDSQYLLVTPAEKVLVSVAAFPFIITDYHLVAGEGVRLTTSIGKEFTITSLNDFSVREEDIFVVLDKGLSAKLGRACYYRFIDQYLLADDETQEPR